MTTFNATKQKPGFMGYAVAIGFIFWLAATLNGDHNWTAIATLVVVGYVGAKVLFDIARKRHLSMVARVLAGVFAVPFAALLPLAMYLGAVYGFI